MSAGIYKITCIPTGRIYIGSSIDLDKRKYDHFYECRTKTHGNDKLQKAYLKYGIDAFEFLVLEIVEKIVGEDELTFRKRLVREIEQGYLDTFLFASCQDNRFRDLGFNIYRKADSAFGLKASPETRLKMSKNNARKGKPNWNSGKKMSQETIDKVIATKRERGILNAPRPKEWGDKISQSNRGRKMSEESRRKMSLARMGRPPANKGIPKSEETKRKISKTKLANKHAAWNKGKKHSETHHANWKKAMGGAWAKNDSI